MLGVEPVPDLLGQTSTAVRSIRTFPPQGDYSFVRIRSVWAASALTTPARSTTIGVEECSSGPVAFYDRRSLKKCFPLRPFEGRA